MEKVHATIWETKEPQIGLPKTFCGLTPNLSVYALNIDVVIMMFSTSVDYGMSLCARCKKTEAFNMALLKQLK